MIKQQDISRGLKSRTQTHRHQSSKLKQSYHREHFSIVDRRCSHLAHLALSDRVLSWLAFEGDPFRCAEQILERIVNQLPRFILSVSNKPLTRPACCGHYGRQS